MHILGVSAASLFPIAPHPQIFPGRFVLMTKQFVLHPADRRQLLLGNADYSLQGSARKLRMAEVVGGTAAECAAVCCCPCSLVNLLVLAVYTLPAGLLRKALRRKRRRRLTKAGAIPPRKCSHDERPELGNNSPIGNLATNDPNLEVAELDKEMFEKFRRGGFWRSSSRSNEL